MSDLADLDALSSRQLHDLAIRRARRHVDVAFLWKLLSDIPAGEAISGEPGHAAADAAHLSVLIADALDDSDTAVLDALRPVYLDYLNRHRSDLSELGGAGS